MLRYHEYKEHTARGSSRLWMAFSTALAFAAVPVLRLLCRLIPPLRRAINDTSAGRMGAAFRTRDRGDHQGASCWRWRAWLGASSRRTSSAPSSWPT